MRDAIVTTLTVPASADAQTEDPTRHRRLNGPRYTPSRCRHCSARQLASCLLQSGSCSAIGWTDWRWREVLVTRFDGAPRLADRTHSGSRSK